MGSLVSVKKGRGYCNCKGIDVKCTCSEKTCSCNRKCKFRYNQSGNRQIANPLDPDLPKMGGDTIFNFNHGKYDTFRKILQNDDIALKQLERCAKNHHSLLNFSLMPRTGGLNNVKGNIFDHLDRFDTFVYFLDDYYHIHNDNKYCHALLNGYVPKCTHGIREILKTYLKKYNDVKDYCQQIYFIAPQYKTNDSNDPLLERLIENGKKPIQYTDEVLKEYMTLAEDYWAMRHNELKGESRCKLEHQENQDCLDCYTYEIPKTDIKYFYIPN